MIAVCDVTLRSSGLSTDHPLLSDHARRVDDRDDVEVVAGLLGVLAELRDEFGSARPNQITSARERNCQPRSQQGEA